jgi:hypothetical protein
MTENDLLIETMDGRVRRRNERREMFRMVLGAAAVGAGAFAFASPAAAQSVTDADVLNFALNLEYLEANFYSYAAFGTPIDASLTTGTGTQGAATGGRAAAFTDPLVAQYAKEIANDEIAHVKFLRTALGAAAVAQPKIDVGIDPNGAFSSAARAAGLIGPTSLTSPTFFDPYANDINFLLGAFIFEDVGVTAYKGASPLLANKTYLEAAAGILAVEAYHASIVRTVLYAKGVDTRSAATKISDARDSLDGSSDLDQGLGDAGSSNIVPLDSNGIAYSRSTGQVLNIVYLTKAAVSAGGFFPAGLNGSIKTSTAQS